MEIKSPSYSIPPLSGRLAGLEIDDARAGERERERRPIRKEDVRREDIRVVRTEDDSSALRSVLSAEREIFAEAVVKVFGSERGSPRRYSSPRSPSRTWRQLRPPSRASH